MVGLPGSAISPCNTPHIRIKPDIDVRSVARRLVYLHVNRDPGVPADRDMCA